MNQHAYRKSFVIGAVAIGVIAGVAVGFFTAHSMRGDIGPGIALAAQGQAGDRGIGAVPAAPGRAGEMDDMKGMSMQGMPGMSAAPSGAVVVPAVMRQLIGVRSAPAGVAVLGQEIRAVGMVGYDERGFTQVTVKTSGWVKSGSPLRTERPIESIKTSRTHPEVFTVTCVNPRSS